MDLTGGCDLGANGADRGTLTSVSTSKKVLSFKRLRRTITRPWSHVLTQTQALRAPWSPVAGGANWRGAGEISAGVSRQSPTSNTPPPTAPPANHSTLTVLLVDRGHASFMQFFCFPQPPTPPPTLSSISPCFCSPLIYCWSGWRNDPGAFHSVRGERRRNSQRGKTHSV